MLLNIFIVAECEIMTCILAIPIKTRLTQVVEKTFIHRVICIFDPQKLVIEDKALAFIGEVFRFILKAIKCQLKIISHSI